jgi:hypothetical protein
MSAEQPGTHWPFTHSGVLPEQPALLVHIVPVAEGWQVPCASHVKPFGHAVVGPHCATHWPLSHTLPPGQSLLKVHAFFGAVHCPLAQTRPPVPQSMSLVQGQGPFEPPQVMHWLP